MPVCGSCGQDNPEQARFCLACGSELAQAHVPSEERKLVSVLFCDLVGSTATAERLDPEDVRARLSPYYARVRQELERFGGTVEKFIGDAVVALFGAPVAHEDDAERAVRAALAVRDAVAELNASDEWLELRIRVGVHTGEALIVLGAQASRGEGMAAGDVMNTAARLQSGAPVDGILVGAETYRATREAIEYREAEPLEAKGKAEPVPVWEALGLREAPARRTETAAPLVGRQAECEALTGLWDEARADGRIRLAFAVGAPGIGKTRLLEELSARAERDGTALWGRCLSYGEGITYWPVVEILKGAAGILQSDDAPTISAKLGSVLDSLPTSDSAELRTMAAALANLVGVPTTPRGTYSAGEIGQSELHWGIRRVLELLSAARPLLLVFEDLHWAEPTLLELLHFVGDGAGSVLVVGSARPELRERDPGLLAAGLALDLEALSAGDSESLVTGLLAGAELPGATLDTLLRNAGGNPLFLEETIRMLEAGGPTVTADGDSVPVPTTLQALIGSRLDQLPSGEKRAAQHASVGGSVFWTGAVAQLEEPAEAGDLPARLARLEQRDLIRAHDASTVAGEREYGFKHVLIRDVAYGQLPKGRRAGLHVRFAEWIALLPGMEDEFVEIVAYHLEQSCRLAREVAHSPVPPPVAMAVEALARAAAKAEGREGMREADRFYARALELLEDETSETAVDLRVQRGRTLSALGELGAARELLTEAAEDARALGRLELRCAALLGVANIDQKQGRGAEARRLVGEAGELAVEIDDPCLRIRAGYESAKLRSWFEGEGEAAIDDVRRALALAEEIHDRALRVEGHMRLGGLLFNVGRLEEADAELLACFALAGDTGSQRDEARAVSMLAFVRYYRGELDEARAHAVRALEQLERTGDSYLELQNVRTLAKWALARGAPEEAERRLRDALPLALESGGWLVLELYRYLAEALVQQGRIGDAAELVAFGARNLPEEDLYARAALLLAEATVATATGEQSTATASFEEALRLLEEQRMLTDLGEARIAFARALRSFGEPGGAQTELERARAIFKRMDARVLLEEIDRELAELTGEADAPASPAPGSA